MLLLPVGLGLLLLQALSELVKRIAYLRGTIPKPMSVEPGKADEKLLAEEFAAEAERKPAGAK